MNEKYTKTITAINTKTQEKIDLAQVLMKFESAEQKHVNLLSPNPLVNPNCVTTGINRRQTAGKFFPLNTVTAHGIVTANATPLSAFYWFKKLYEYYQVPANKAVPLESAIPILIKPFMDQIRFSYDKIEAIYSRLPPNSPMALSLLENQNQVNDKMERLERMPEQLIKLAKKYGRIDDKPTQTISAPVSQK